MEVDADRLVEVAIKIRDAQDALTAKYKEEDSALQKKRDLIEAALLDICKDTGTEGLKTAHGTVSRVIKERIWTADWDAMKEFIKEHDGLDLLEHRIHQTNFKAWREANPEVVAPVNSERKYSVTIRRSKSGG